MWQDSSLVSADIFTPHHRYSGQVNTKGVRMADFLNDVSTEAIDLRHVRVSQPTNAQSESIDCEQLWLRKDTIVLAIPVGTHEAPARRLYSYIDKQQYSARITVPGHCLTGTLHLPARANRWMLISEGATVPSFAPITDVIIRFTQPHVEPIHAKVAIFRRQLIESLYLSERPVGEENAEPKVAPADLDVLKLVREISDEARSLVPEVALAPTPVPSQEAS